MAIRPDLKARANQLFTEYQKGAPYDLAFGALWREAIRALRPEKRDEIMRVFAEQGRAEMINRPPLEPRRVQNISDGIKLGFWFLFGCLGMFFVFSKKDY